MGDGMSECKHCGAQIYADELATWIDNSGGDVCGWNGGNEPHEPDDAPTHPSDDQIARIVDILHKQYPNAGPDELRRRVIAQIARTQAQGIADITFDPSGMSERAASALAGFIIADAELRGDPGLPA